MSEDEKVNGPKIVADILNSMDSANREKIVSKIKVTDPSIALKIEENMYSFEDIAELSPKSIQNLTQAIDHKDLVKALKVASNDVKEAIYSNLSSRMSEMIKDELDSTPKVQLKEVEKAQKQILETVDKLRGEGKVISKTNTKA